jgi:hypothetical protein
MRIIRKCTNKRGLGRSYQADLFGHEEEYSLCPHCENNLSKSGRKNCLALSSLREWCEKWAVSSIIVGCPSFRSDQNDAKVVRLGEPPAESKRKRVNPQFLEHGSSEIKMEGPAFIAFSGIDSRIGNQRSHQKRCAGRGCKDSGALFRR